MKKEEEKIVQKVQNKNIPLFTVFVYVLYIVKIGKEMVCRSSIISTNM